ncbi:MAG: tripartite tricarboxylate transporter substrate binding protein [Deltaproteobacteria bacterium]|nr:tripartite tricarboxylate transporter substrate binding protein [Deltaproteobacteria bacterium]
MFKRLLFIIFTFFISTVLLMSYANPAQAGPGGWVPKQPIKMIVPWPAGGGTDLYARIVAPHWKKYLPGDQPIVIVNKSGGGGVIGTTDVYNAKPNGYTIGLTILNAMILNQLTSEVKFDMRKFEILGGPSLYTRTVYANPKSVPDVKTWKDVLSKIHELRIATYGFGSTAHVAPLFVGTVSKLFDPSKLHFVHYKGTAGVVAGFQRGDAEIYFGAVEAHDKYAKQGLFRTILILDDERNKMIPDIPTAVEAGIPGAQEINSAFYDPKAFIAPPGTPKNILDTYAEALMKALKDPACLADAEKAKSPMEIIPREKLLKFIPQAMETWSKQKEILKLIKGGA